jgi:hypothetical protein
LITLFELHQSNIEEIYLLVNHAILFSDKNRDKYFLLKKVELVDSDEEEDGEDLCLPSTGLQPTCVVSFTLAKAEEKLKAKKVRKIVEKVHTEEEKKEKHLKEQIKIMKFLNKKRK